MNPSIRSMITSIGRLPPVRLLLLPLPLLLLHLLTAAVSVQAQDPTSLWVEGYTGQVSYQPGDDLSLHLSSTASVVGIEIARLGVQRETVTNFMRVPVKAYPVPDDASANGCGWPVGHQFKIPSHWRSGYYLVTLRVSDGGGSYSRRGRRTAEADCFFILRPSEPGKNTSILLQLSSNTYNAYNNYGGLSLYSYNARGGAQGHRVSFLRPPASQFNNWERPFVEWAEAQGYTLDYCANQDLEARPELLAKYRLVLSVGHDEYWSSKMRDHLEEYIGKGGNVAFFSGNTCCWQVRSEDNGNALTCWKQAFQFDPVYSAGDHRLLSTLWSHHLVGRPENQLTGVGFLWGGYHLSHGQFMDGKGAYTVHQPDHWIFQGTQLKRGDTFGAKDTIVGYECDGCEIRMENGLPVPTGNDGTPKTFSILGTCEAKWHPDDAYWYERFAKGRVGAAVLGTYTRGGTVVTSGATDWAHGLRGKDPIVERITRNILDRLSRQ